MRLIVTLSPLILLLGRTPEPKRVPMENIQWQGDFLPFRILVIEADTPDDPLLVRQRELFQQRSEDANERDLLVIPVTGDEAIEIERHLGMPGLLGSADGFEVRLIGKDTGVKLKRNEVVDPQEIFDLIDSMPMRQLEMRERKGQDQ